MNGLKHTLQWSLLLAFLFVTEVVAEVHVLLVGAADDSLTSSGPENDIGLMKQVLLNARFGIEPLNVTTLLNKAATQEHIQQALQRLAEQLEAGDNVYLHEASNHCEGWFVDDKIVRWVRTASRKVGEKGSIVLVSDTCRTSKQRNVKTAPPVHRHDLIDSFKGVEQVVLITASQKPQHAFEIQRQDRFYGILTWYWAQTIQQAEPNDAWRDLFLRARIKVNYAQPKQWPAFNATGRIAIFSSEFPPPKPTLRVIHKNGRIVRVNRGIVSGVTEKSEYVINDPETPEEKITRLIVKQVDTFESVLEIVEGDAIQGHTLVEKRHYSLFPPLKVWVTSLADENETKIYLARIKSLVMQAQGFRVIDKLDSANFILALHPKRATGSFSTLRMESINPWFGNAEILVKTPRQLEEALKDNLSALERIHFLKNLGVNQKANIELRLHHWSRVDSCGESSDNCELIFWDDSGNALYAEKRQTYIAHQTFPKGDVLFLEVKNLGNEAYYFCPVLITDEIFASKDKDSIIELKKGGNEIKIAPGESVLYEDIFILINGKETVKVFVTSEEPICHTGVFSTAGWRTKGVKPSAAYEYLFKSKKSNTKSAQTRSDRFQGFWTKQIEIDAE